MQKFFMSVVVVANDDDDDDDNVTDDDDVPTYTLKARFNTNSIVCCPH